MLQRRADACALGLPRVQQADDQVLARRRDVAPRHLARQMRWVAACLRHADSDNSVEDASDTCDPCVVPRITAVALTGSLGELSAPQPDECCQAAGRVKGSLEIRTVRNRKGPATLSSIW